jgi:uncharacterized repeat protein (TIGR01451 family)
MLTAFVVALAGGLLAVCWARCGEAIAAPTPSALSDVEITVDEILVGGLDHPVQVTHAGDGSGRLFAVEQSGQIRVLRDGVLLPSPLLDLTDRTSRAGERGLLGLAFHPQYQANGYLYVNYTRDTDGATVVTRFTASQSNPDVADPASATEILSIAQPYGNHNGGQLLFGPDGYLYVGMGDGGGGGDPLENAQDSTNLLGAMLRLDVDSDSPYAIPWDNPYVDAVGRDEIWAIGLRNPWRFSFDRVTGDLYIGDVGQNAWEEISYQEAGTPGGLNFGWDCLEGTHTYEYDEACSQADLVEPIVEYGHDVGRSVTGGFVYRGSLYPNLQGRYFYADYVNGKIWSIHKTGSSPDSWSEPELEVDAGFNISAFGEDESGELYVCDWSGGTVRRLADANGPTPILSSSRKAVSPPSIDKGETATYTIALVNTGGAVNGSVALTDTVPAGLRYVPGSLDATAGSVDATGAPTLHWRGEFAAGSSITVTYRVTATGEITGGIVNGAVVGGAVEPIHLIAALFVPRPVLTSTRADVFLPGTQPNQLDVLLPDSVDCDICHSEPIYDQWRGSMMSQAGRDPLMWAALEVASHDAPGTGDYCLRCHVPKGWLEGRSRPGDGSALEGHDTANGVACEVCHRMVDPRPTASAIPSIDASVRAALTATVPAAYVGSGTSIVDADDNRRGPFAFAQGLPYHTAYQTAFLGQTSEATTRARLCGTCHNVDNPLLSWDEGRGEYWPNEMNTSTPISDLDSGGLFRIESTYDEWRNSAYANGGVEAPRFAGDEPDGVVEACQDCHLRRTTGTAADPQFGPTTRDCQSSGCLPEHTMVGGNAWLPNILQNQDWRLHAVGQADYLKAALHEAQWMLRHAASMTVTLTTSGTQKVALVRAVNEAGHKLPTGYPEGRQMWIHMQAFDGAGTVVYESGAYDSGTRELVRDEALKVYEVKQGISESLATLVGEPAGASFHLLLNNQVVKDNRIPPRGYTQAAFDKPGLRPVRASYADGQHWDDTVYVVPAATERVFATLYYQTASKEYVQFLRERGGIDGQALLDLWEASPSPPQVMARAWWPRYDLYLPVVLRGG